MKPRRRAWLHCSGKDHGDNFRAVRRPPIIRGRHEPDTPRLCVAPTLAQALAAVWWVNPVHVYQTEPRAALPPLNVHDAVLTGERWVVPPVVCTRVLIIPYPDIAEAQHGLTPQESWTGYEAWLAQSIRFYRFNHLVAARAPAFHRRHLLDWAAGCVRLFLAKVDRGSSEATRLSDLACAVTLRA